MGTSGLERIFRLTPGGFEVNGRAVTLVRPSDDLRVEGVVRERLDGVEHLTAVVDRFSPGRGRRLGVLVDHLVPAPRRRGPLLRWRRIPASVRSFAVLRRALSLGGQ